MSVFSQHEHHKAIITKQFKHEFADAMREYQALLNLYKDVCWYNFETHARTWQEPWHESFALSPIAFHGVSVKHEWKHGRLREIGHFPLYYSGPIKDAPPLPPMIIYEELKQAEEYSKWAHEQQWAAYDWAPGGHKYEKLVRESEGAQAYHALYYYRKQTEETKQLEHSDE